MRGLDALLPRRVGELPKLKVGGSSKSRSRHQLFSLLLLLLLQLSTTSAQFCTGTETFEKVEMTMMAIMTLVMVTLKAVKT